MKYSLITGTDMKVSELCLGTWVFGGDCWGDTDDSISVRVTEEAIDSGINFIDTAPIYGAGRAEVVIGKAIKGKRDKVLIATKCGLKKKGEAIDVDLSAEFIRKDLENSLRRLGIDAIDLYQCHWPSNNTRYSETFGELDDLKRKGKIRNIGVSNFSVRETRKAMEYAPIVTNQVQYSLLDRRIEEELMPFCEENNVGILPYGVLGGGILTGKYKEPPRVEQGDVKDFFYRFYKDPLWSRILELVSVMDGIALQRGARASQVAINWVRSHRVIPSCIVGCRTLDQLRDNLKSLEWELTGEESVSIDIASRNVSGD